MKSNNRSDLSIFQISSAYIGTVVGAGFASGQEVLQFFAAYGWKGLLGLALSTFLFFFIGYSVLVLGRNLRAKSHVDIVRFTNGKVIGTLIDIIITVFLFGALAAMIAGAGAIFNEQFNISAVWGTLVMGFVTLLTVITGTKGVINAISCVVPFLIVSVLIISVVSILNNPITADEMQAAVLLEGATPNWFISSVNYASYNTVIAIAVLAPMGALTSSKKKLFYGALFGAMGLGLGILAIYLCLLTNIKDAAAYQVPMIEIAAQISIIIKLIFAVVLFAEVYTTAVGNLYGFVMRLSKKTSNLILMFAATAGALLISQLGFSNMVRYLYPAVGYGGLLFFAGVIYTWATKRRYLK